MAPIPEGFAQVTHLFVGANCPEGAAVTYGLNVDLVVDPQNNCDVIHASFGADIVGANLTADVTLQETQIKYGPTESGPTFVTSAPLNGSGAINTSMAPNTAYLCNKVTASGGRRGRGRFFLPGVFDGAVDDSGIVAPATVAQIQTGLDGLMDTLVAEATPMVLLHSPTYTWVIFNNQPRRVYSDDVPPAPSLVTALVATSKVATQRNRLRR